jgi:hypothetical protein
MASISALLKIDQSPLQDSMAFFSTLLENRYIATSGSTASINALLKNVYNRVIDTSYSMASVGAL